jgi:N-methylhydantoinase A
MSLLGQSLDNSSPEESAWGVIQVANANMERAIRRISVERGYDPRSFTLVAFGGAGPLHACELAEAMQIPRVLIPSMPGVLSALGMLVARPARDYSVTVMRSLASGSEDVPEWLSERYAEMLVRAEDEMTAEGSGPKQLLTDLRLDLRYVGQAYELTVPVSAGSGEADIAAGFHRAHAERYGFKRPEEMVQVVNVRLTVEAKTMPPVMPQLVRGSAGAQAALIGRKQVWFGAGAVECRLYNRDKLRAGNRFRGPAIVFQYDTTTVIPPSWVAEVDAYGNLILRRE